MVREDLEKEMGNRRNVGVLWGVNVDSIYRGMIYMGEEVLGEIFVENEGEGC